MRLHLRRGVPLTVAHRKAAKTKFPKLVFSGMEPTHGLHRGNYGLVGCLEAVCGPRLELAGAAFELTVPSDRSPSYCRR